MPKEQKQMLKVMTSFLLLKVIAKAKEGQEALMVEELLLTLMYSSQEAMLEGNQIQMI